MASTNDLKNGLVLNIDGQLWTVVEFQHVKPGKGPAFVRTKLKNVLTGKVVDKTFNAGVKVETANVDKRDMQYLYNDGTDFVFMDGDTYDQISVTAEVVGDAANYLLENQEAIVAPHDGAAALRRAARVRRVLEITYTEPGLQGDRSTGGTKPATLETGAEIQVPLFLETGDQGQGRHPRRLLPRSGQLTAWPPAPRPASARSTCSSRPSSARSTSADCCVSGWPSR